MGRARTPAALSELAGCHRPEVEVWVARLNPDNASSMSTFG